MRFAGYQPQYFPRLHYFARLLNSDVFAFGDYLQFVRRHAYELPDGSRKQGKSYQAHSPIKIHSGKFMLAVPIKHRGFSPINVTEIAYQHNWVYKHKANITSGYSKAPNFADVFPEIEALLDKRYDNLAELNIATVLWGLARIINGTGVDPDKLSLGYINEILMQEHPFETKKIALLSQTDIPPAEEDEKKDTSDWIVEICRKFGADEYYHGGSGARAYMDFDKFDRAEIRLTQQNWNCPGYTQQFPKVGFIRNLSIIDLLMNERHENITKVLQG